MKGARLLPCLWLLAACSATVGGQDCGRPPPGTRRVAYTILLAQTHRSGNEPLAVPRPGKEDVPPAEARDGQEIQSEDEYLRMLGVPSAGIDWKESRILVVELTTVYKLGALETSTALSWIAGDSEAVYLGITFTQYGPCQGIAQQSEWFSYEQELLFILLPARPGPVVKRYCSVGGCPPDLP
jgi:hypothetical protein